MKTIASFVDSIAQYENYCIVCGQHCAIWKLLHRLWTALRNLASVSLERSYSEHLREWI